jgi:hypothetical protein
MTDEGTLSASTPYGVLNVPAEPEPHTLWNAGPAGTARLFDVRLGTERELEVPGGSPDQPAGLELASSDEVFVGWVERAAE